MYVQSHCPVQTGSPMAGHQQQTPAVEVDQRVEMSSFQKAMQQLDYVTHAQNSLRQHRQPQNNHTHPNQQPSSPSPVSAHGNTTGGLFRNKTTLGFCSRKSAAKNSEPSKAVELPEMFLGPEKWRPSQSSKPRSFSAFQRVSQSNNNQKTNTTNNNNNNSSNNGRCKSVNQPRYLQFDPEEFRRPGTSLIYLREKQSLNRKPWSSCGERGTVRSSVGGKVSGIDGGTGKNSLTSELHLHGKSLAASGSQEQRHSHQPDGPEGEANGSEKGTRRDMTPRCGTAECALRRADTSSSRRPHTHHPYPHRRVGGGGGGGGGVLVTGCANNSLSKSEDYILRQAISSALKNSGQVFEHWYMMPSHLREQLHHMTSVGENNSNSSTEGHARAKGKGRGSVLNSRGVGGGRGNIRGNRERGRSDWEGDETEEQQDEDMRVSTAQFQLLDFAEKHDRERVEVTQKRQGLGKTELRVVQRKKNGRRALLSVYLPNINKQQQQQQQQSSNKHKKGEGISHRSHKNDDSGNNDEDDDDDDDHNYCTADQTTEQESQPDSSFKFSPQFPLREQNSA